jgi:hypothetical protein
MTFGTLTKKGRCEGCGESTERRDMTGEAECYICAERRIAQDSSAAEASLAAVEAVAAAAGDCVSVKDIIEAARVGAERRDTALYEQPSFDHLLNQARALIEARCARGGGAA